MSSHAYFCYFVDFSGISIFILLFSAFLWSTICCICISNRLLVNNLQTKSFFFLSIPSNSVILWEVKCFWLWIWLIFSTQLLQYNHFEVHILHPSFNSSPYSFSVSTLGYVSDLIANSALSNCKYLKIMCLSVWGVLLIRIRYYCFEIHLPSNWIYKLYPHYIRENMPRRR